MEIQLYFRLLRRGWWIVALTTLSALNIALGLAYTATPLYRATARFIITPTAGLTSSRDVVSSLDTLDKRSINSTYAEVLNSNRIYRETVAGLNLPSKTLARYDYSAVVLPDANVIELSVAGPDPHTAALLANSLGQRAIEYSRGLNQVYDITFLDIADPPGQPFSPQPLRDASLAVVLGASLGAALAIIREQLFMPLEALKTLNIIDSVSSAHNRRYFLRALEEQLARSSLSPLSLGLVQLQGLRDLIDTLPQPITQRLLHEVVAILRKELRGHDLIGRWDEYTFALLLPATPGSAATRTLERITQILSFPIQVEQLDFDLRPITGIGVRQGNDTSNSLIQRAEKSIETTQQNAAPPSPFSTDVLSELGYWDKGAEALSAARPGAERPAAERGQVFTDDDALLRP